MTVDTLILQKGQALVLRSSNPEGLQPAPFPHPVSFGVVYKLSDVSNMSYQGLQVVFDPEGARLIADTSDLTQEFYIINESSILSQLPLPV